MDSRIFVLFAAAIAIEGVISWGKTLYVDKKVQWQVFASIGISILVSIDLGLNIFSLMGITESVPFVGTLITAIAISRGTNYLFEFYNLLQKWRNGEGSTSGGAE